MPFIPDEQEKTVKIPIQVRNGRIQFYFDGPLPLPSDGPAFSDNPPKPLPLSEQQAVYRKVEVKEVGRQRA